MSAVIPLFPLGTVLLPGAPLPLHIFEQRYRQLVADLLELPAEDRQFGVVAIQAGREVRILVSPEEIDDLSSSRLARDVVRKIEEQLQYPGQIKVTVIRETRAVDYAR